MELKNSLLLYVIPDIEIGIGRSLLYQSEQALDGGATAIQLRSKNSSSKDLYELGCQLREATKRYNALFIVNDRLDIALATHADGVHLGGDDLPITITRKIAGSNFIIGRSVASLTEAQIAEKEGADYLGAASIYPTTSKDNVNVIGLEKLKEICLRVKIPVVGIGGINQTNINEVFNSGVSGISIISAIFAKEDIKKETQFIKRKILSIKSLKE
jgi:thiamine-phosphate pyrophosphorylase